VGALQTELARTSTTLEHERSAAQQRAADLAEAQQRLREQFEAVAAQVLHANSEAVVQMAEQSLAKAREQQKSEFEKRTTSVENLVTPLRESLSKVDAHVRELEAKRAEAYSGLSQQVKSLTETQAQLTTETTALVTALRKPQTRGQWGETQLRRAVELAGMVPHCDFSEQVTTIRGEGGQRPDMVINLPEKRHIVVDAKVSLAAFLDALASNDPVHQAERMKAHAKSLRDHVNDLAQKSYWDQFAQSPEFVVLFVPGESMLAPALENDPQLLDDAFAKRVVIATPTVLIAVLRTAAFMLQQASVTDNAIEVSSIGRELYKRLGTMGEHLDKLGRSITTTVKDYNKTIGSMERNVLVSARRLNDLGIVTDELPVLAGVEESVRPMTAAELIAWEEEAIGASTVRSLPGRTAAG
jgi:DNA recombination protein RmuC